jgi:tRNA threonylcarbamoyladenosine modification (KEOPS) complex  Pcc1 subunit
VFACTTNLPLRRFQQVIQGCRETANQIMGSVSIEIVHVKLQKSRKKITFMLIK